MGYTFEAEHPIAKKLQRNQIIKLIFHKKGFDFQSNPFNFILIIYFMNLCLFIR
jgi:hypothetical protein